MSNKTFYILLHPTSENVCVKGSAFRVDIPLCLGKLGDNIGSR